MTKPLRTDEIEKFITDGFIRVDNAFSATTAAAVVDILWLDIPFNRSDARTWTKSVIHLGMYDAKPFLESVNTPGLYAIFDQLIGAGKWIPCRNVGIFPVRFPSEKQPEDTGKHVDASFPGDDPGDYLAWRINVRSKGRALLMLVLYSDVSEKDAPTIICKGSHIDVARLLHGEGDQGLSFMELAARLDSLPQRETALATGKAGSIYLCHPFLVHAAQAHKGTQPKFMAQPPLLLKDELTIAGAKEGYTPVEQAIRLGINL